MLTSLQPFFTMAFAPSFWKVEVGTSTTYFKSTSPMTYEYVTIDPAEGIFKYEPFESGHVESLKQERTDAGQKKPCTEAEYCFQVLKAKQYNSPSKYAA